MAKVTKARGMLRRAILRELDRRKRPKMWLARRQRAVHPGTCLAYLYSGRDIRVSTAEAMLHALGLDVVRHDELAGLRQLAEIVANDGHKDSSFQIRKALNGFLRLRTGGRK